MKELERISHILYSEMWQVLPQKLAEMQAAFVTHRQVAAQRASDPVGPKGDGWLVPSNEYVHPQVELYGDVAVVQVNGVTGKRLSWLDMACGGFDSMLFIEQLKNVAGDPNVKALVVEFNSPGGMAAGNVQVCEALQAVSAAGKKTCAWIPGLCASAAYYWASACEAIVADRDALLGSISTMSYGVDSSANWAMNGLELKLFATGQFKATGMPGKAWTAEEEKMVWDRINPIDAEFKGFVKQQRGLTDEDMQGQVWYARYAPAGVVDHADFDSLEEVIAFVC